MELWKLCSINENDIWSQNFKLCKDLKERSFGILEYTIQEYLNIDSERVIYIASHV
jgi:hypothetical protein